ncbi:ribonuclease HI [Anaplasma capra]|uniref:ribonuclease HI n=1 Tax=Anaplasma capra TaxID=1562740 RepID=UPI0021D5E56F|nr:ribonuclease HI [Anaplasma capra]MCU7611744.1 ribonuclease HI [Anaplasma capra]MCU7612505.1 ribonuclease HI [Anaplasma capra]
MERKGVAIYTDGACSGNPGPGGWGAVLLFESGEERRISGGDNNTTNNRMELTAVIMALANLTVPCGVCINTDSTYVKNGITEWIGRWKMNGWRTSSKSAVKNVDLWVELERLTLLHSVEWRWVKAHAGDKYNEEADALARNEAERRLVAPK